MRSLKIGIVAVFAMAGLVALIPASAMAASHATVTIGQVTMLNLDSHSKLLSFKVNTPPIPTGPAVTVNVNKNTKFIPMSGTAKFAVSDYVWASGGVGKHQYASTVKYGLAPFAIPYAKRTFNGTYVSGGPPVLPATSGTLVIKNKAGKNLPAFTTNSKTVYRLNGKIKTPPTFTVGERMTVYGQEYTDGLWRAKRVDIFKK
jgi:hypothetical protein